jgi:hypothetical protein
MWIPFKKIRNFMWIPFKKNLCGFHSNEVSNDVNAGVMKKKD